VKKLIIILSILILFSTNCRKRNKYTQLVNIMNQTLLIQKSFTKKLTSTNSAVIYALNIENYISNIQLMKEEKIELDKKHSELLNRIKYPKKILEQINMLEIKLQKSSKQIIMLMNSKKLLEYSKHKRVAKAINLMTAQQ